MSSHYKELYAQSVDVRDAVAAVLNSGIFYAFFKAFGNCRDLKRSDIEKFRFGESHACLVDLCEELSACYKDTATIRSRRYPSGYVEYDEYYPTSAKPIIDEIDRVLAEHYGFTDEELDFIINYDIKYRMGGAANGGED